MKLLVASDIHGSAYYCRKLLEAREREGPPRMLLLGDILYHGPRNDLPRDYAPKEVIAMLNPLKDELYCVRGNCEAEVDQMVLEFPVLADYCLIPLGSQMIFCTHGHIFNEKQGGYPSAWAHPRAEDRLYGWPLDSEPRFGFDPEGRERAGICHAGGRCLYAEGAGRNRDPERSADRGWGRSGKLTEAG